MASKNLISSFLIFTLSILFQSSKNYVQATDYTVGDEGGWDQGVNYLSWSQKYNFAVDDVLVFNYVKGQHDVYQVTEDTYRSCDPSTGVEAIYHSGSDRVNLTEATQYWFICHYNGHCSGGMKLGITVNKNAGTGKGTPWVPPADNGAGRGMMRWGCGLVFGMFVINLLKFI